MKRSIWALLPVFSLFIPLLGQAQANQESDPLLRVIELTSQVHFDDASGAPVVVPAGDYWVNAAGNTLTLAALDGASNFALKATAGTHDNELDAVTALVYDAGEELPDTVFIALMSPDGQQVVAQGSLSGVQQRGVLSDAKKKAAAAAAAAAAARKRALDKARQVAAAKAKQAEAIAQQAAAATGQAVQTVRETAQTVGENIHEAMPGTPLKDMVDAASSLGVQNLLSCLANARDDRQGNIAKLAQQFATDPAGATFAIQGDIQTLVDSRIDDLSAAIDRLGDNPSVASVVDVSFDLLSSIGKDRPAIGCLMTAMQPHMGLIKQNVVRRQQAVMDGVDKTINEKLLPAIMRKVEPVIAQVALGDYATAGVQSRGLGNTGARAQEIARQRKFEDDAIATGLYMQILEDKYATASARINDELAKPDPDIQAIRDSLALTSQWTEESALRFGVDMVRIKGHQAISSGIIKDMLRKQGGLEALARRGTTYVTEGICGLVPELGAFACSVIFVAIEVPSIFLVEKLVSTLIEQALHIAWGNGVDYWEDHLVNKNAAGNPGLFGRLLLTLDRRDVILAADKSLPPGFKQAFLDYNASVESLLDRWEKDRQ